ncbi:hypothetical protein MAR_001311, partial [Mya arenaria]
MSRSVFSACPPGLCSLDETSFFRNEYCDIKADTECDINVNCNGDGKCYFDQYTKNTTCICSEKRIGDMCQYNYTTFGMPCSSNLDCHSGVCIVAGPGDNRTNHCDCPLGLKGARCEQIDRQYLSESWECENEARAYIQGQYLGCSCKCGTVGQFCEEMDERAPYHYSCDNQLCKRGECVRFIGGWPKFFSYGCKCPNGFVGTFCQYPNTTGMPPRKPSRSQCPSMGKYPVCENGVSILQVIHTNTLAKQLTKFAKMEASVITMPLNVESCVNVGGGSSVIVVTETAAPIGAVLIKTVDVGLIVWRTNVGILNNAIYTVTGGGNATRINGAHNGYQPETRSTPTHTSDAQARQTIEQLNANNNVNTSQNSTHTESNNDPPSYEEVCQPPPTYSDVLR